MALRKCKECGKEISSDAKTCPHCGFAPKRTSAFTWIVTGFVVLLAFSYFRGNADREEAQAKAEKAEAARLAALTPAQRKAEAERKLKEAAVRKAQEEKDGRLQAARGLCRQALMRVLNDPDSAKLDPGYDWYAEERKNGTTLVQPSGRAKNAFGAYIHGVWNCVTRRRGDMIELVSLKQIRP